MDRANISEEQIVIDHLTYCSYLHNRLHSPEIAPERWARIYPNAQAMEARYLKDLEIFEADRGHSDEHEPVSVSGSSERVM